MIIPLSIVAAFADCIEAVDMAVVAQYQERLRGLDAPPPILVRRQNRDGFYVIEDGHHRIMAHHLECWGNIRADIRTDREPVELSWRWPRVIPVADAAPIYLVLRKR